MQRKDVKKILVLGGSGRIGSSVVKNLTSNGHEVYVMDRTKNKDIQKNRMIHCDISNINSFNKKFQTLVKNIKELNVVVNLSYIKNKNWGKQFLKINHTDLKENLFLQLGTVIMTSKEIINFFLKKKKGNLILFSSIQGVQAPKFSHYKNTNMVSPIEYSASKAGIINITKYLAKFCKGKKIKVNCISPGGIRNKQPKIFIKRYKESCLSKGLLDSSDLNGIVDFLVSDKSNFLNGQNLIIDDGWSL